ncbi:protein cortex isoform X2 [Eurosta solidaginis]|uniref:protein cortex isoform X2 n=1 Tax=Eurosta solidaginis TaxID=178769 RepID=UPI00353119C6
MNVYSFRNCLKSEMFDNPKTQKTPACLKKRGSQWENEVLKILRSPFNNFSLYYGDRFIPRRNSFKTLNKNLKLVNTNIERDVLKVLFDSNYWRQYSLKIAINKTLELEEERILQLSERTLKKSDRHTKFPCFDYDWHCIPRSKPLAFAETTHDSPGFDSTFDPNMVDWSVNEQIVASFGQDVIIWKRCDDVTMLFNVKSIKSLAFSPAGTFLAIGCKTNEFPVLELWEVGLSTKFLILNGKVFSSVHGEVHSIVWSHNSTQVICGTGLGCLYVLSVPDLNVMKKVRRHKMPIERIKLSPNRGYLASGDTCGDIVVYNWPSCDVYFVVRSKRKLNTDFDWHPWNGDDLIIAETVPASIVVLHVPSKEIVAYYQRMDRRIVINYLTFSKITAELLVSVCMAADDGRWDFKILVMASLNRVVDLINIPGSGARFVVWSPDGTKLATCGNDETLTIWNFRPENKPNHSITETQTKPNCSSWKSEFGKVFDSCTCLK